MYIHIYIYIILVCGNDYIYISRAYHFEVSFFWE